MDILNSKFLEGFVRVTDDAFKKGWHERNGGNYSYRIKCEEAESVMDSFSFDREFTPIGVDVPNLAGEYFLVTGSGKFMRNVILDPAANICVIQVPTHLMNHSIKKELTGGRHRVILHSHPTNLIALTFILPLTDEAFTRELWEMATECPVVFPDGVGVVPWMVPGGRDIALATAELMKKYDVAVWAHHGIFCSGEDFDQTFGLMDTVEKSAEILVKVLSMGGKRQTITAQNFRDLAKDFKVTLPERFLSE